MPERAHEQAEAEQAVDDRRHAGQVRDVDLDQARELAALAVLLEVDGRAHADGQREKRRQTDQ